MTLGAVWAVVIRFAAHTARPELSLALAVNWQQLVVVPVVLITWHSVHSFLSSMTAATVATVTVAASASLARTLHIVAGSALSCRHSAHSSDGVHHGDDLSP